MHRFTPLIVVVSVFAASVPAGGQPDSKNKEPVHLREARTLVENLKLVNTSYKHGTGAVRWKGSNGAVEYESRTDCSGFINHLLAHSYGYKTTAMKRWLGKTRPTAEMYHDKIEEGVGFENITHITDARPGDIIAVKYITRNDNTGHVMLIDSIPAKMTPRAPSVSDTVQWQVSVIDSSKTGHGPTDTRSKKGTSSGKDHPGLGRGVLRIYADPKGNIAGFSWSTRAGSNYVSPRDERLVIGRLKANFRP